MNTGHYKTFTIIGTKLPRLDFFFSFLTISHSCNHITMSSMSCSNFTLFSCSSTCVKQFGCSNFRKLYSLKCFIIDIITIFLIIRAKFLRNFLCKSGCEMGVLFGKCPFHEFILQFWHTGLIGKSSAKYVILI